MINENAIFDFINSRTTTIENSECLIWTGGVNSYGNPKFRYDYEDYMTCRFIYEHYHGKLPKNIHVRHSCLVKLCINPDHLYIKSDVNEIQNRFSERIIIPDDWETNPGKTCWSWTGLLNDSGYGVFTANGKHIGAHRFAWESYYGPIPEGKLVCHKCDNTICCNPHHLFLGTADDNNKDRTIKGRRVYNHGSKHHNSKLTENEVIQIRKLLINRNQSLDSIAKQFGVSRSVISHIEHRKIWNHI